MFGRYGTVDTDTMTSDSMHIGLSDSDSQSALGGLIGDDLEESEDVVEMAELRGDVGNEEAVPEDTTDHAPSDHAPSDGPLGIGNV